MKITDIRTLGELRKNGYKSKSIKDEIRNNLITRLKNNKGVGLCWYVFRPRWRGICRHCGGQNNKPHDEFYAGLDYTRYSIVYFLA